MKKIYIRKSKVNTSRAILGAFLYCWYVKFNGKDSHSYSIETTKEGMMYLQRTWSEAGYETIEE